jgi:hypothetical protein
MDYFAVVNDIKVAQQAKTPRNGGVLYALVSNNAETGINGGWGWIRTSVLREGRFTVCCH